MSGYGDAFGIARRNKFELARDVLAFLSTNDGCVLSRIERGVNASGISVEFFQAFVSRGLVEIGEGTRGGWYARPVHITGKGRLALGRLNALFAGLAEFGLVRSDVLR